jgi:hypothetical protein
MAHYDDYFTASAIPPAGGVVGPCPPPLHCGSVGTSVWAYTPFLSFASNRSAARRRQAPEMMTSSRNGRRDPAAWDHPELWTAGKSTPRPGLSV